MAKSSKASSRKKKTVKARKLPASLSWLKRTRPIAIGLFLLSALLYANTFGHEYAQDDAIVITENMFTTEGVSGWPGIFQKDTFFGFFKEEGKAKLVAGGRYRPLTLAMFALEYELFGDSPQVMHVFNALWYGLTVVVLYWLLLLLFQTRGAFDKKLSTTALYFVPLAAALLFSVHPIHTEAVANIKGRDEILTLLGSIAALYFVLRGFKDLRWPWPVLAGFCFFLALLSKENAITFLGIAPLALYYFTKEKLPGIAIRMIPLVAAAVVFLAIRGAILGWDFGQPSRELMNNPFLKIEDNRYVDFSTSEKAATITYTLGKYVQLALVPYPLTHDYYPRHVDRMSWGDWRVLLSLVLYLGLLFLAVRGLRNKEPISFGILFYLLALSIVSNIVFPVGTNMSERFLFMPSVGVCLVLALLLSRLEKRSISLLLGATGVIALVYAGITIFRNPVWQNNYTLFSADIHTSPNSAKLRNAMAGELSVQWTNLPEAEREANSGMLREAVGHIDEAIRFHPNYKQAHYIKGNLHFNLKEYDQAIQAYQQALRLDSEYQAAFDNLMVTYREAGKFYGEQRGDVATAITYLEQARAGLPNDYETLRLLGVAYGISGNSAKAVEYFTLNTQQAPDNARAWYDLGIAYGQSGEEEQAATAFQRARSLDPDIDQKVQEGN